MGHWIEYTKVIIPEPYNKWEQAWKCSECGFDDGFIAYSYCPNCGVRMEPEEEDKGGKLVKASDAVEALSEKFNIPMDDLVDLFAEIPGIPRRRITENVHQDAG